MIYLHYVLDLWFEREVKPRLQGEAYLVRYADNIVIGFERQDDAERVMEALRKRMGRFECPTCKGRMKLVAMITEPSSMTRFLSALGKPTDVAVRSPDRGPPYWKSTVLRRKTLGDAA